VPLIEFYVNQENYVSLKIWRNGLVFVLRILASIFQNRYSSLGHVTECPVLRCIMFC